MIYLLIFSFLINIILFFLLFNKNEVSVDRALRSLKENLIRVIVFYQRHYPGSDQLLLIEVWLGNIRKKLKDVPKERIELFKEKINSL